MSDLKSLLKGGVKKETTEAVVEKKSNKAFTQEQLKKAWDEFAETKRPYVATYHFLSQGFQFIDNQVVLQLLNPFQETELNTIRVDLLTHLRKALQNDTIQLIGELKEFTDEDKSHLYLNDKERLNLMIKKNPLVKELKDRLRLDTDS